MKSKPGSESRHCKFSWKSASSWQELSTSPLDAQAEFEQILPDVDSRWTPSYDIFNFTEVDVKPFSFPTVPHLQFNADIDGIPALVLLDSGATKTLLSTAFVEKYKLKLIGVDSPYYIKYNREITKSSAVALPRVKIGPYREKIAFGLSKFDQYDAILGLDWLSHNRVIFDYEKRCATFTFNGKQICLRDIHAPSAENVLVTEASFNKYVRKGELCFMLHMTNSPTDYAINAINASGTPPDGAAPDPRVEQYKEKYPRVFREELEGLPQVESGIEHHIHIYPGSSPVARAPYRLSVADENELKRRIRELLKSGHIQPSVSPWAAPILFVKKKDGTLRFCVDYRGLNKVTVRDQHALPVPEDQLRRLSGAKIFTKLDLRSGYYQVKVAEEDVNKTAFTSAYGSYEFLVMPFGLTNAPATFMRLMNKVLAEYIHEFVVVYLDDILIYSQNEADHEQHVDLILKRLAEFDLAVKLSKCSFFQSEVEYLGFVVSDQGVSMSEEKVKAILDWPVPKNKRDVRSFLGLTGFYRQFIRKYAHVAAPLHSLTKATTDFHWQKRQQNAFNDLKQAVSTAPVLQVYDKDKPCVVYTDASDIAAGAVLMQAGPTGEMHPVAFYSHKLHGAEMRYDARSREFLAIKLAACKWRPYLHNDQQTVFYTDHESLQYLNSTSELDSRFIRWYSKICAWIGVPEIRYQPGKSNVVADALSRRPDHHFLFALHLVMPNADLNDQVRAGYEVDPFVTQIEAEIESGRSHYFYDEDGLLQFSHDHGVRLFIPDAPLLREQVMAAHHDAAFGGHFGRNRMLNFLQRRFWWPKMKYDVAEYIRTCPICQRTKASNSQQAGLLQPLAVPKKPWDSVSVDFITGLPETAAGFDAIMVTVDRFSKYAHFVPTKTTSKADATADLFYNKIVCEHQVPLSIVSDRDSKFTSEYWQNFWSALETKLHLSTAYHPQTDGQTERLNRVLEEMLRAYCWRDVSNWDQHLAEAAFAYNTSTHESAGFSPFFINFGYHPRIPAAFLSSDSHAVEVSLEERLYEIKLVHQRVKQLLEFAQQRQKKLADRNRIELSFEVGDFVMLKSKHVSLDGTNPPKLSFRFVGPFKVEKKVGSVAYRLEMPSHFKGHPTFHVSVLKKWHEDDAKFPLRADTLEPPPLFFEGDAGFYIPSQIIAARGRGKQKEYRVAWKGWNDRTWESASHFAISNPELVASFESSQAEQRRGRR